MNKKIIVIAVLILAVVVVFAACKKDEYVLDYTVPLDNGDVIEVYENEDGENFVTNVDGDHIPITTDKDGFYDDIEVLITETTKAKSEEKTSEEKSSADSGKEDVSNKEETPSSSEKNEPSSSEEATSDNGGNEESSTESTSIEIVKPGEDGNGDGIISWEDIKNA